MYCTVRSRFDGRDDRTSVPLHSDGVRPADAARIPQYIRVQMQRVWYPPRDLQPCSAL
jgi:hypothetical protein